MQKDNFLTSLREIITAQDIDVFIVEKIIESTRKTWGGSPIYIKKTTDLDYRNAEILRKFNGRNSRQLCKEYDLCYQQVCKIISQGRKLQRNRNT